MATTTNNEYTMEQLLAEINKTNPDNTLNDRTIRFYIVEKLLETSIGSGRYARYNDDHLLRLRVIEHLKKKFKLSEINKILSDKSLDLHSILADAEIGKRTWDTDALKKMVNPRAASDSTHAHRNFSFAAIGTDRQIVDIFSRLERPLEPEHESWKRLRPVDGIEINIRDDVDPKIRELAMQLISQLHK